jgi:hypothetical protein
MKHEDHTLSIRGNAGPIDGVVGAESAARIGAIFIRNVEIVAFGEEDPSIR